jgi:hypothetical protein
MGQRRREASANEFSSSLVKFVLPYCTSAELFFSCCESIAASRETA